MTVIRMETQKDHRETENVVREAFWNVYAPGCSEHYLLHQMRECTAYIPELNLVAEDKGKIIGQAITLKAHIKGDDETVHTVLTLGPIAVLPEYQKTGIGAKLIAKTKEIAKALGYPAILLCGSPDYYSKQGFEAAEKYGIRNSENMLMDALQVYGLYEGALESLSGKYYEDSIYEIEENAVKEFDKAFVPKTALSDTPSQKQFLEIASRCRPNKK